MFARACVCVYVYDNGLKFGTLAILYIYPSGAHHLGAKFQKFVFERVPITKYSKYIDWWWIRI